MHFRTTLIVAATVNLCVCRDSDANLPDTVQFLYSQKDRSCPNQPHFELGSDDQLHMKNDTTQIANKEVGYGRRWCTPGTKTWVIALAYDPFSDSRRATNRFGEGNPMIIDALMGAADLVESTLARTANGVVLREDGVIHWDGDLKSVWDRELAWQFKMSQPRVEITAYNRQPYQLTYGVLGAGLRGARDLMRLSNATAEGLVYVVDGENVVGIIKIAA